MTFFIIAIFLISLANAQNLESEKKIERTLALETAKNPEKSVRVIVWVDNKEFKKYRTAADVGNVRREFPEFSAIVTEIPANRVKNLAKMGYVKKITLDMKVYATRLEAIPIIKSDSARATYSVNATPIKIAIIDTGVFNHSEFQNPNRIISQKCFCADCCQPSNADENSNATDDNGHGTHVAGIAAGAGNGSSQGVAVNASIMAIKVLDNNGGGYDSDVATAINWAVQNGANVISLSLGVNRSLYTDCYDSLMSLAVDNATDNNVVVVVSAGNSGSAADTIGAPGCAKTAITVGSVNDGSSGATPVDGIVSTSSRGPANDNRTKPDITAPGKWIKSTVPTNNYCTGSGLYELCDDSSYLTISGTSMAAPFISGVAALIINKFNETHGYMPEPARVKAIIMTAVNTTGMERDGYYQRNNHYGAGRMDVMEAMRLLDKTRNDSLSQGQQKSFSIFVQNPDLKVTLYWPENSTTRNNLDLIVGNATHNFTNPTDSNDTVEQVFLSNITNGTWTISINGTNIIGTQKYFIVFSQHISSPMWKNNISTKPSGAIYAPQQNYSFQIFWNDTSLGTAGVSHAIFQLGATNYSKNSNPAVQNSSGTFWINMTDVAAGTHDLIWYANNTNNAWNSSVSTYTIARNYSAQFINLTINGTNEDASFPYDSITNITAWKAFPEGNLSLYRNSSLVGVDGINKPNETLILSGGIYNYTLVFPETQNYSFVNTSRILTITRRVTNTALLINGTLGNFVYNLSQIANFTAYVNITGKNITLTSNMTGWLDQNSTNAVYNLTLLSVTGIFNMTAYFAGDQNYSSSFQTSFATVRDANAPNILGNQTNPGSGVVYYSNQIYKFNLTVSDDAGISHVILQFNSTNYTASRVSGSASSGNWSANITDLAANATGYPVIWYANDTSNNWNKSDAWHYIINKNASAYTVIRANATTTELPRPFHVNSSSPVDSRIETRLYGNITATALALLNASASTNTYTWSFGATGIFNISANSSANENYTANATLEYVILTSLDTTSPILVRGSVLPRNVSNNRNISILIISDDYSATTSSANIYNTTNHSIARFNLSYVTYTSAGVSSLNRTTLFIPFNITNLPSGIFYVNVSLTDFFGNSANYSAGNFTATSGAAGVLYGNSSLSVGQSTAINLTSEMNITLNISSVSEYDYSDSIAIALYVVNPSTPNSNAVSINKYYDIDVGGRLNYTTDWAEIRIFYNVSDVGSGYSEGNLRIYKLHSNGSWMPFSGANLGGVNTTAKYAWANTTSFSLFGAFVMPTCSDSIQNQDETGVDCGGVCSACSSPTTTLGSSGGSGGGGGGATTTITTTTTTTTTTATTTTTGPTNAANTVNASATTTTTTTILKKAEETGTDFISILIAAMVTIAALILAATAYVVTRHHEKIAGFVSKLKEEFFKIRYKFK